MLGTCGSNGALTFELALAVNAQWVRCVVFDVRGSFSAIEHIVRGVVNQRNAQCRRFLGEDAGRNGVDCKGQVRFAFSLVHSRMSRCVDDQVRFVGLNLLADLLGLTQIKLIATQYNQFAKPSKLLLQLDGDLTGFAADKDFQRRGAVLHASRSLGSVNPRR